ncbi:cytochrome P450 [Longimycelium tulufanense]|uniref:Cytochrome P450 n=1 Tax=Longimycelium tulufanense TaxID=907463 RepID=A0A8J3CL26_9PSEU|nr:cytochrome P450 [Longimycelium tulufanense]GGM80672.1 cytochrome P450 [Longimycelium tulufanense]
MTDTLPSLPDVPDLFSDQFHNDQYCTYRALRDRQPVSRAQYTADSPAWIVTSYEESKALLQDSRLQRNECHVASGESLPEAAIPTGIEQYFENILARRDPPGHTRLRRVVAHHFTAHHVRSLRPRIQQVTNQAVDRLTEQDSRVDLVEHFADPLPARVLGELLNLDHDDREELVVRTHAVRTNRPDQPDDPLRPMVDFALRLLHLRRSEPGEDLVSDMVRAHEEGRLDDTELVTLLISLLLAGLDVTSNLISTAVFTLLTHPEQLKLLREQPALIPQAVEEVLRYRCPLELAARRFTREPVEANGVRIPEGQTVQVVLAAANRDPRQFPDPDRFDIARQDTSHVAFGHGAHFCVGAALGRVEAEIALATLLERFPRLALVVCPTEITWLRSFLRAPSTLPVQLG